MFQSSAKRFRALLGLVDGAPTDPKPVPVAPHPHRQRMRLRLERRAGAVPPRFTHCLSPVRPPAERARRDPVS